MIRLRTVFLMGLLTIVVIFFAGITWLFNTTSGARWVLSKIPHLSVQQVQGSLSGQLQLTHMTWKNASTQFTAQDLRWQFYPSHLLVGSLDIGNLQLSQGVLHLPQPSQQPSPIDLTWPRLPLWTRFLSIRLSAVHMDQFQVWQGKKSAMILTSANIKKLAWQHGNLHIEQLKAQLPSGLLQMTALLQMERRHLQSHGSWTQGKNQKTLYIQWHTDLQGHAETALGGPLQIEVLQNGETSHLASNIQIAPRQILLNKLILRNPALSKPATGHWQVDLPANSAGNFSLHGGFENIFIKSLPATLPVGALSLRLKLAGTTQQYHGQLALQGTSQLGVIDGALHGNTNGLTYQYAGQLLGAKLLPAHLSVDWKPQLKVQGQLRLRNLSIQRIQKQMPGQLSGDLQFSAASQKKILHSQVQLTLLPSQIYRQSLQGKAEVTVSGRQWNLQQAHFYGPGVNLKASGNVQQRLNFSLHVANWQGLVPGTTGTTNLQGWLAQTHAQWYGNIRAEGQHLRYRGLHVAILKAAGGLSAANALHATLDAQGLEYQHHLLNVQATAQGVLTRFALGLHGQWQDSTFSLEGLVSHPGSAWSMQLQQTNLHSAALGIWQLQHPATIAWQHQTAQVTPVLFTDAHGAAISAQGHYNLANHAAALNVGLQSIPLDFHTHTDDTSLEGYLNADLQAHCNGQCQAAGHWDFQKTQMHWKTDAIPHSLELQQFTGQLQWSPKNLTLQSKLTLQNDWGHAQISLHSPATLTLPWHWNPQTPLNADIQATLGAPLFAALPVGTLKFRPQGEGTLQGQLSGTWAKPLWHGNADLKGLGVYIPQAGLDLQDVGVHLTGNGNELHIQQLRATSGTGQLSGNGVVHLEPDTTFHLHVTGSQFTTLNLPQVQAAVSPDLQITGTPKNIAIGGTIHTNRLRILGTDFSGPKPSSDVVFVKNIHQRAGPALSVNLGVTLGNDAKVLISGLRAKLEGKLDVKMDNGQSPQVLGILRMVDGHYAIYGHTLDFEHGSIHFEGAASQANLDVLAIRTIKNSNSFAVDNTPVKAGVQITGTLQVPQVTLYSTPSMSQADILSYLVLGSPSSSLGNQDELLSAAAGTLFSASRAAIFGNSLSNTGIDVGVTSNGTSGLSGAIVTLGHYLTPDLYLSVGQSVMGNGTIARLRYNVTKNIELQTESGTQNGANIFYKIDF